MGYIPPAMGASISTLDPFITDLPILYRLAASSKLEKLTMPAREAHASFPPSDLVQSFIAFIGRGNNIILNVELSGIIKDV